MLSLPRSRALDRMRHQLGHRALAAVFGAGTVAWHRALRPDSTRPPLEQIAALHRWFLQLTEEDFANVEAGHYPRALALEFPVGAMLRSLPEALVDLPSMVRRARQGAHELPHVADDGYPDYYRRAFHWQVDGWLSPHSARVYDLQAEFLFFGTMDMMRRMALPPIVCALRGKPQARVLDMACGTGRLLHHLQRTLPDARLFGVDLSPHYVERAHQICAERPGVSLLVANAEAVPLADSFFDAVTCGFLFHELPRDAQRRVMAEVWRLLRPGGVFVFQDAAQQGDRNAEELSFYLDWFPNAYHEPYFKGYAKEPVEEMCREVGLEVLSSEPKLLSKVVVARK